MWRRKETGRGYRALGLCLAGAVSLCGCGGAARPENRAVETESTGTPAVSAPAETAGEATKEAAGKASSGEEARFLLEVLLYPYRSWGVRDVERGAGAAVESVETEYAGLSCVETGTDSEKVMKLYLEMRESGKREGYTPLIILRDDHCLDEMLEFEREEHGSLEAAAAAILEKSEDIDAEAFFSENDDGYEMMREWEDGEGASIAEEYEGRGVTPQRELSIMPYGVEHVYIARVPADKPYEVFAYLPFGGFNSCPGNEEHIAVARKWYEKYGAVPCAIGSDTVQYYLETPVSGADEAAVAELTREMAVYCLDIVDQGVGTLGNLSETIGGSQFWFFWWD